MLCTLIASTSAISANARTRVREWAWCSRYATPLQLTRNQQKPVEIFGTIHGYGYLLYLITAADLGWRARWSLVRTVLVLLAGTIPFMSFVAEHIVTRDLRAAEAAMLTKPTVP